MLTNETLTLNLGNQTPNPSFLLQNDDDNDNDVIINIDKEELYDEFVNFIDSKSSNRKPKTYVNLTEKAELSTKTKEIENLRNQLYEIFKELLKTHQQNQWMFILSQ